MVWDLLSAVSFGYWSCFADLNLLLEGQAGFVVVMGELVLMGALVVLVHLRISAFLIF